MTTRLIKDLPLNEQLDFYFRWYYRFQYGLDDRTELIAKSQSDLQRIIDLHF